MSKTTEILKLSPTQIKSTMRLLSRTLQPAFIWGPPGIGKSQVAKELANDTEVAFIDIRLSQMDPTDVRGMPFKVEEGGVTIGVAWSPPTSFPRDLNETMVRDIQAMETEISFEKLNPRGTNNIPYVKSPKVTVRSLTDGLTAEIVPIESEERYASSDRFCVKLVDSNGKLSAGKIAYTISGKAEGIMAFEEMNSAPPSVLAACYQIVLDRRSGDYKVPDAVSIFAMGNREDDRGVTFRMPDPLANRFTHVEMQANHDDWLYWAIKNRVNSKVVGYVSNAPAELFKHDKSASRGFATPRSWGFVSSIVDEYERNAAAVSPIVLTAAICGSVGDASGLTFIEFMKIAESMPNPTQILDGKVTEMKADKQNLVALSYHVTTQLLYLLSEDHQKLCEKGNFGKTKAENKDPEREQWSKRVNNWLTFSMNNFKPEIAVMAAVQALRSYGIPIDDNTVPAFGVFIDKYGSLMTAQYGED